MNKVSASSEDYLKAIIMVGGSPNHPVRSVDVARMLHVSKTAVNKALTRLKEAGLARQSYYGQISLTDEGFAYGQKLSRRHNYLMVFLTKELGIDDDIAELEACRLEHAISDSCFEKWIAYIDRRDLVKD